MRKALPLLLALPILAAGIWAKVTSEVETLDTPAPEAIQPERRAWRTGIELLSKPALQAPDSPAVEPVRADPELLPSTGLTRLSGRVVNADGAPLQATVFSTDCPGRAYSTPEGDFELYVFLAAPAECDLQAMTQHGMLNAISETVWVEVEPEVGAQVVLEVDDRPQGGIGVAFLLSGDGAEVTWVHPFGPAMAAGLEQGDVIEQVNDLDLRDVFDPNLFIQETVGPVGSEVEVFLKGEDQGLVLQRSEIREAQTAPSRFEAPSDDEVIEVDTGAPSPPLEAWDETPEPAMDTAWWDTGWQEDEIWTEAF